MVEDFRRVGMLRLSYRNSTMHTMLKQGVRCSVQWGACNGTSIDRVRGLVLVIMRMVMIHAERARIRLLIDHDHNSHCRALGVQPLAQFLCG